jgi:ribonuclease HI
MLDKGPYLLQFDGGAQPNPGKGSGAAVLFDPNRVVVGEVGEYYTHCTNNFAEYMGLILGLEMALKKGVRRLVVEGDSMLVIQQVSGIWKVSAEALKPLCVKAKGLLALFEDATVRHVPRAQNAHADALSEEVIHCGTSLSR